VIVLAARLAFCIRPPDHEAACLGVDLNRGALADLAGDQGTPDPRLDLALDEAAQGPSSVNGVVTLLGDQRPGLVAQLELEPPVC
jgi:hypothetical protein